MLKKKKSRLEPAEQNTVSAQQTPFPCCDWQLRTSVIFTLSCLAWQCNILGIKFFTVKKFQSVPSVASSSQYGYCEPQQTSPLMSIAAFWRTPDPFQVFFHLVHDLWQGPISTLNEYHHHQQNSLTCTDFPKIKNKASLR